MQTGVQKSQGRKRERQGGICVWGRQSRYPAAAEGERVSREEEIGSVVKMTKKKKK